MRTRSVLRLRASSGAKLARRASTFSILSVAAALAVTNLTPVVVSSASWTDNEWDNGSVGTLSCADDGSDFKTRGAGRLIGGGLLPLDLDDVATVEGMTVTNDGALSHPDPANAQPAGDAYVNPFDVGVLSAINLPLTGGTLDGLLEMPFATEVGAVNQYALADDNGVSQGASGVVNDSGVIQTNNDANGNLPTLGTLKLSTLVEQLTGEAISDLVTGITDLKLDIGAVASRATLDACDAAWTGAIDANLTREYAIAGLDAEIEAPVVEGVSGALGALLTNVQTSLNVIAGDSGLISEITGGVGGLLSGVLGGLSLGNVSVSPPTITLDRTVLDDLAKASISDDGGLVLLNLETGQVRVNLAALLGEAYNGNGFNGEPGLGLNDLPPNTELLINGAVTGALAAALTQALSGWSEDVLSVLESAIDAVHVSTTITVELRTSILGINRTIADITVDVDGTLTELAAGEGVTVEPVLRLTGIGAVDALINGLLGSVLTIAGALTSGVGPLVAGIINDAIGETGLIATLAPALNDITAPIVNGLSVALLGLNNVISLRANLQNDPAAGNDPDPAPPLLYPDWESGPMPVPDDQYDVAALGIGVLNAAGTTSNVNLELARSSVGVSCAVGGVWDLDGRCAGY